MPLRNQLQALLLILLLAPVLSAQQETPPNVVVSYSFDDDNLATGPDTFTVFNHAKGNVNLTTTYCRSGYRSVEIHDVAGDKEFPELQGYFPLRRKGRLFAHFAFMTTAPDEPLNMALAGPEGFTVRKGGIGFWLSTEAGILYHHSNKLHTKLIPLEAFAWYAVDVTYHVAEGTYDLTIRAEDGKERPLVSLTAQKNAPGQVESAVDKFSFIGDLEDKSNVTYYVDDVLISFDEPLEQKPFIAPGRRKLFVDRWNDYYERVLRQPHVIPAIALSDFGIHADEMQSLKREKLLRTLEALLHGRPLNAASLGKDSPDNVRLLRAISLWMSGNEHMEKRRFEAALGNFAVAAALSPEGKIYQLSAVPTLAALKRRSASRFHLPIFPPQNFLLDNAQS
jgi:hypothetical protein